MAEEEDMEHGSTHKHVNNTSTNGRILTELLLNSSKDTGYLKGQEKPLHNQIGRKKEKKNRGNGTGPTPVAGAEEEMFPHRGKPPCGRLAGTEGSFRGLEESPSTSL